MQRHQLSAVCAAAVMLLAGVVAFAGAGVASSGEHHRAVDAGATDGPRQQEGDQPRSGNVTVETLRVQNVTFVNVSIDSVVVRGTVTTANGTVIETPNGTKSIGNVTARRLFVTNATLHDVTLNAVTVRDQGVANALFERATAAEGQPGARRIERTTLRNETVRGVVIDRVTVEDVRILTARTQGVEDVGDEAGATIRGQPALGAQYAQADRVVVEQLAAIDLVVGNATIGDERSGGPPSEGDEDEGR